jgi:hypothetical protein
MEHHPDVISDQGIQRANGEVTPVNAGDVLARVIDELRLARLPLSSQAKGIIAKQIKSLLEDGFDWQIVGHAAVLAIKRGTPQHTHFIAGDLAAASAGVWLSTREEYRRAVQDEVEIAQALRRLEESP